MSTILLFACKPGVKKDEAHFTANDKSTTTYYIIRHADKDTTASAGNDPALTEQGEARAKFWAEHFKNVDFDAVYSTDFNRTRSTAKPTAEKNGLEITYYNPSSLYSEKFLDETAGKNVLIVGHSNTITYLTNKLIGKERYKEIDESVYGNLYVVSIKNGRARAELKNLNNWDKKKQ